jgi:hypothetical protein
VRQVERGRPARRLGTALGALPDGQPFRVEYAVMSLKGEAVVARFLGPPDALAFNLGLLRRALATLEAGRLLTAEVDRPLAPALEAVALPGGLGGRVAMPSGWSIEPAASSACGRVPPAESGLAASPPGDFTVVLRVLRWPGASENVEAAVRACGGSSWSAAATSAGAASAAYSGRFDRLGVPVEARGVLVRREDESLLLELDAPAAKVAFVADLHERWVRAAGHPSDGAERP